MKLFMFILNVFFVIFWGGLAIATICGYAPPVATVVCAMLLAAIGEIEHAIQSFFSWKFLK